MASTQARFTPDDAPIACDALRHITNQHDAMVGVALDMFADLPSDGLLNLRFEDMLATPEAELRRLARFIDPSLENEASIRGASIIPRQTPCTFARLDHHEHAAITKARRPGLERLGYVL